MSTPTLEAPGDVLRRMLDDTIRAWDPIWQSWSAAMPAWPAVGKPEVQRAGRGTRGRGQDCGCGGHRDEHEHGHERAHEDHPGHAHECGNSHRRSCARGACDCCVGEADLVVVTRLGESRIVPLVIHNEWRRERTVEVTVGEFEPACHEEALVRVAAATRPRGPVTLAPCARVEVGILLRTATLAKAEAQAAEVPAAPTAATSATLSSAPTKATVARKAAAAKATAANAPTEAVSVELIDKELQGRDDPLPDVGCCTTMYADVRVSGCGRPLRLAVVVLPMRCDAYEVDCHCGCC